MRLTGSKLRQIIKEELSRVMSENFNTDDPSTWPMTDAGEPDWDAIKATHGKWKHDVAWAVHHAPKRSIGRGSEVAATGISSPGAYASKGWAPHGY